MSHLHITKSKCGQTLRNLLPVLLSVILSARDPPTLPPLPISPSPPWYLEPCDLSYNYPGLTISHSPAPTLILTKAVFFQVWGSSGQGQQQEEGACPLRQLSYSVSQTWSLCAPHLYTCLPLLCLFFKMLKTFNKKQIQNAVINSQFQANPASLLINLNTCKRNNKFCTSLVLGGLLYTLGVCVCMWVSVSTYIFISLYFPSREGQNNELRASGKMNLRY